MRHLFLALAVIAAFLGALFGAAVAGPIGGGVGAVIGLAVAGALVEFLKAAGAFKPGATFTSQHGQFDCPACKETVEAVVHRDPTTRQIIDIETCSHFEPPQGIKCKKTCVERLRSGEVEFRETA